MNMAYVLGINGSPRKEWNTAQLLESALSGAADGGAQTELVHLCDLSYTGCMSCFSCKRKDSMDFGHCILQDDAAELIERIYQADAVVFGQPIYHWDVPGRTRNLFERIWFPSFMYQKDRTIVARRGKGQVGLIYTCNVEDPSKLAYVEKTNTDSFRRYFQGEPMVLWATDTMQFEDYSLMVGNQFDPIHKKQRHMEHFPKDLKQAFRMGKALIAGK